MDEHKCPNYSIGIPPRCPKCGKPTPPERLTFFIGDTWEKFGSTIREKKNEPVSS